METIWNIESRKVVEQEELIEHFLGAEVIYLGEKHDNARQHEIQLQVLEALISKGKRPSIGFEFFTTGQTSLLMDFTQPSAPIMNIKSNDHNPESVLRQALGWDHRS
ncbi:MAG: ChaN family lipoprotein, partial [bacterium]